MKKRMIKYSSSVRHFAPCFLAVMTALGLSADLEAQSIPTSLDSLYQTLSSARSSYTPAPAKDPLLLELTATRAEEGSELVDYLHSSTHVPQFSPSILSAQLGVPLVLRYDALGARVSLPTLSSKVAPVSFRVGNPGIQLQMPQIFLSRQQNRELSATLTNALRRSNVELFTYGEDELMVGRSRITHATNTNSISQMFERTIETGRMKQLAEGLQLQEIEIRHWVPAFESSVQFSQNYVSDNWYKGGASNLNLYMRTYFAMLYTRGKIRWNNELEDKLSLYTADGSADQRYRISEDLLRLRSNFGLKASKLWSYTVDGELRTQLFSTYNDDRTIVRSALLSPLTTNIGLGMQYNYATKSKRVYGRKFSFSANIAPISHTYRYSSRRDIDLARHGLSAESPYYHRFGSTLRANLQWDFSMDISWSSRVYFNTSYTNVEAEWENTLTMRISRYFSTRVNLHLRYDDSVSPRGESGWKRFVQVNELLSFGFNYKL